MTKIRELSFEERATYCACPVCKAPEGEACNGEVGFALGRNVNGEIPPGGAHLGRLQKAPLRVREVPVL